MSTENPFSNEQSDYLNSPEHPAHQSPHEIDSTKESIEDDGGREIVEAATSFEELLASLKVAFPGNESLASNSEAANAIKEIEKASDQAVIDESLAKIQNAWVRERAFVLKMTQTGVPVAEDAWMPIDQFLGQ